MKLTRTLHSSLVTGYGAARAMHSSACSGSACRPVVPALLGLLFLLGLWAGNARAQVEVPHNWSARPAGLQDGAKFRLIFLTTTLRDHDSINVASYDGTVRSDVNGNADLSPYANQFKALVSTSTVNAIDHVGMTGAGTGISIWWVGGKKVADSYTDFWDGTWDNEALSDLKNEHGNYVNLPTDRRPWTGTTQGGMKATTAHLGAANFGPAVIGNPGRNPGGPIDGASQNNRGDMRRLYGVSPVFQVTPQPAVFFTRNNTVVWENAGTVAVTVRLRDISTTATTVRISTTGNTASSGTAKGVPAEADFLGFTDEALTIPAGQRTATKTITIFDDLLYENGDWPEGEEFTVNVVSMNGDTSLGGAETTVTIVDDEYTFCFTSKTYLKKESDGVISLPLRISRPLPFTVTATADPIVDYITTQGVDYEVVKGTHTYRPGQSQDGDFQFRIINDRDDEPNELFRVTATVPAVPDGEVLCSTDVIIEDDDFKTISVRFEMPDGAVINEGESFTVKVSSPDRPKKAYPIRFYLIDESRVYIDQSRLLRTVLLPARKNPSVTVDIPTIRSDKPPASNTIRILALGHDRRSTGEQPYAVTSGKMATVTVNEMDDASASFVTLHIPDNTVDEGGVLKINVSAWSIVNDPAFCRKYWDGHYTSEHTTCFVEGTNKALSVNVEVTGDSRLPLIDGEFQEKHRYTVEIPRSGFNNRFTRQTLKLRLRNDAVLNTSGGTISAKAEHGEGYTLVTNHPVFGTEDSINVVDDEKSAPPVNPIKVRITGYDEEAGVFSDDPLPYEGGTFYVCVNLSRPLDDPNGDEVEFKFTATTEGSPGARFFAEYLGNNGLGGSPKELAGGTGTLTMDPQRRGTRECGLGTARQLTANRDPEHVVHLDLDTTQLPPGFLVEKPRATFTIRDRQTHPVTWNLTHDGPTPLSIKEDGATGDFTFRLSEPLDVGEVYDLILFDDETRPQYTFSLSPNSPAGSALLTKEQSGVEFPSRRGLGKVVRFKGAGAQTAIVRVTGVHDEGLTAPNPLFDSNQPESATNPRRIHTSLANGIMYPGYATGRPYTDGSQPVWHTASDLTHGDIKQNFNIINVDAVTVDADIGWISEHFNVPEHNGPAQPVIKLSRSLPHDVTVNVRHNSIGSTEGDDWRIDNSGNAADRYLGMIVIPAGARRTKYDIIIVKNDNIAEGPEAIGIEIESVTPNTNIKAKADRTFVQRSTVHIFDHQATDRQLSLTCPASVTPDGENEVTLQCTMTLQDPVASNRELSLKAKALLGSSVKKTVNLVFASGETTKSFSFSIPYHAANFGKSITVNLDEAALHDTSTDPKSRIYGQEVDVYMGAINGRWVKTRYFGGTSILKVKDVSTREGGQAELRAVIDPWPKGVESIKLLYSTRYHEPDENNRVPEGYAGPDEFHHYVDEPVTCTENGCSFSVFTKTDSDNNEKREKFYVDVKADPSVPARVRETIDTVTAFVNIEGSDIEDVRYNTTTVDGFDPARIREDGGTGDFVIRISRPLGADEVYELHFTPEMPQYVYSLAPDNPKGVSLESAPDEASCRGRPMGKILRFEGKGTQRAVVRVTGIKTDHKISNPLFDSKKPESATDNPKRIHGSLTGILVPCYATPVPYLKNLGPPDGYLKHGAHYAYGTTKHSFVIVDVDNTSSLDIGWSQGNYAVNENNGPAQPVLMFSRPLVQETRVRIVHAEGTALQGTGAGKDWNIIPTWRVDGSNDPYLAEFIVPAGVTRVSYDVTMVDDAIAENDETFTTTISTVSPTPEHGLTAASDRKLAQTATIKILDNEKWTSEITCTNEYVLGTRATHGKRISALTGNGCKLSLSNPVPANHTLQVVFKAEIGSGEHYKTVNSPLLPVTPSTSTGLSEIALVKNFSFRDYDRIHESLLGEDIRISIESATLTDTSTTPNRVFKLGNTVYQLDHALARIRLLEEEPAPVPTEQLLSAENVEVREGAVAELRAVIDPWPEDVSGETGIPLIYSTRYAEMDREGNLPPGKAGPRDFYAHWNTPIDCVAVEGGAKGCVIRLHTIQDSHDEGREEFYIDVEADPSVPETLRNLLGRVTATITIVNDDPIPAAWLGRFGRTVAEQALDGISNRIAAPRNAGMQVTLAGQEINSESNTESNTDTSFNDRTQPELQSQSVTAKDVLLNSSFTLTGKEDALGGNVAFWGRAMHSSFDGKEGTLSLDGEVTTTMLGADYARGKWLLGLSLMQSSAEGGYIDEIDTNGNAPGTDDMNGKVEASLTAAVPYASLQASERLRLWGALGHGAGEIGLKTGIDEAIEADISWTMATMGIRGDVLVPLDEGLGPALALTSDAMWAQTLSDKARGIESSESDVTRFRLGLEGSYNIALAGNGRLTPKLESGVRHDGGDAETGFGVEIGGGIAWVDPALGLSLDVSGRTLLAHGNDDLKDRGYAASLAFDPDPSTQRGASFGLRQEFGGQANGGLDALFQPATLDKRQGSGANFQWNMEAAYGFPAFDGRFTGSPHAGIGLATGARDYTLGWRLTPEASSARNLSFDLRAVRRESDAAEPEHTVGFEFRALW